MKTITITLVASLLAIAGSVAEPSEDRIAAATKLGAIMGLKEQMKAGFDAMLPLIDQQAAQLRLDAEAQKELKDIYRAWFNDDLDHAYLLKKTIEIYAETFTKEELEGLAEFYQSPLGKKTLSILPEVTKKGALMGMQEAQSKQDQLLRRLQPFLEKHGVNR